MPNYDKRCNICGFIERDVMEPLHAPLVDCCQHIPTGTFDHVATVCPGRMERVWLQGRPNAVKGDEIDVWIQHGMCWPDGSPRHFTSQAHLDRESAKRGMENYVVHQPTKGGDKSPFTVRWDCISPVSEEDRLKRWHEHEAQLTKA